MVGTSPYLVVSFSVCGFVPVEAFVGRCALAPRWLCSAFVVRFVLPPPFVLVVGDVVPRPLRRGGWLRASGRGAELSSVLPLFGLPLLASPSFGMAGRASRFVLVLVRSAAVEIQSTCPAGVCPCAAAGRARLLLIPLLSIRPPLRRR